MCELFFFFKSSRHKTRLVIGQNVANQSFCFVFDNNIKVCARWL